MLPASITDIVRQKLGKLKFLADVRDPQGGLLAKAQAIHWIVDIQDAA